MRSFLRNLALFLGVLVALDFGLAQIGKRVVDTWELRAPERTYRVVSPIYHHDLERNAEARATWGGIRYPYRTNSLGFRDGRIREVPLRSNHARLLFLGDSFTEGVGVPFDSTYVGILARRLAPQGIEVLNAAVMSYSPAIYYRKLKYLLEEKGLEVDGVVVAIDVSDVRDEAQSYVLDAHDPREPVVGTEPERKTSAAGRVKAWIKRNSLVVNLVSRVRLALQRVPEHGRERLALDADETLWTRSDSAFQAYGKEGLRRARENMDRLLDLARRHGVRMAVVVYPWPDQIVRRDLASRQVTFWRSWAEEKGVPFFNLFPTFIDGADPIRTIERNFIRYDFHWNPNGHRRVAEALLDTGIAHLTSTRPATTRMTAEDTATLSRSAARPAGSTLQAAAPGKLDPRPERRRNPPRDLASKQTSTRAHLRSVDKRWPPCVRRSITARS